LIPVLCDEVQKLVQSAAGKEELARAKSQLRAGILMGRESMLSRANRQAKHMISFNEKFDLDTLLTKIERVQAVNIQTMAQRIFTSKPTLSALGPLDTLESYDKIQSRLAA
jgi:predicted Zn-dependent peptidase